MGEFCEIEVAEQLQEHSVFEVEAYYDKELDKPVFRIILDERNLLYLELGCPEGGQLIGTTKNGTEFHLFYNPSRLLPKKIVGGFPGEYKAELGFDIPRIIGNDYDQQREQAHTNLVSMIEGATPIPMVFSMGPLGEGVSGYVKLEIKQKDQEPKTE